MDESAGTAPLPADRGHVLTEAPLAASAHLDAMSVGDLLQTMHDADRTVADAVQDALPAVTAFVEAAEAGFVRGGRLVYLGAGTSGRLGVLDASECPPTFHVPPERVVGLIAGGDAALRRSSESREDDPAGAIPMLDALDLRPDDTVLGIAAGGTTPWVRGAIAHAATATRVRGFLACTALQDVPGMTHAIEVHTGPEVVTGSTRLKAGTATKMVLNMISTALMVRTGRVHGNRMIGVRPTNAKLRDRAIRLVEELAECPRDAAAAGLDAAGGSVPVAVLMHCRGLDRGAAEARLQAVGGRLGPALDVASARAAGRPDDASHP